jgi:tight adherence protein B
MIFSLVTFIIVFGICYGGFALFVLQPEQKAEKAIGQRLGKVRKAQTIRTAQLLKQTRAMSSVVAFDTLLRQTQGRAVQLQDLLEQAGMQTTVGRFVLACGCASLLAFGLVQYFFSSLLIAIGVAVLMPFLGIAAVRYKRAVRLRKFEEQFPEALDLLARSLRAGHSFTTGIEMVADEMPRPLGPEFALLYDQQNYGMALPDALGDFARRIPVLDARFFVTAVRIQRESGGNLSEVLDNLARVMRDRFRTKRQMRVVSAHGRITGWVLVGLPPVLGTALMIINPQQRELMFGDPLGQQMLIGAVVLQVIGTLVIRRIVNIEY